MIAALTLACLAQAPLPPVRTEIASATAPIAIEPASRAGQAPSRALLREPANGEQAALFDLFATPATEAGEAFEWELTHVEDKPSWTRWALRFPSPLAHGPSANHEVHGKWFLPTEREGPMPAVVVLHWLGGDFAALDLMCAMLAQRGVGALMLYLPHYGPRREGDTRMITSDQELLVDNFRQAVLDVRRAGDWLAAQPEVDAERLGVMGISLGSIVSELVSGIDHHFARQAFLIGGADVPSIVLGNAREVRRLRQAVEARGLSLDDMRRIWHPVEPLTWASRIRPQTTLMVAATDDEIIPRSCTEALQAAIGLEQVEWYQGGHYDIALQLLRVGGMVVRHFSAE